MSQFLLVRASMQPVMSGCTSLPVPIDGFLGRAAHDVFGTTDHVWVIRPAGGEMDDVVRRTLAALDEGVGYAATELSALVTRLGACCDALVLFWSSYTDDLPTSHTMDELHAHIEGQLRQPVFGGELYARYARADR